MTLHFGPEYFESGTEPIWVQILIQFFGSLIGFLGALYIFREQQIRDNSNEVSLKFEQSLNKLTYFKYLIENVLNAHNDQKEQLKIWISEQKKDLLSFVLLKHITTYDFYRILLSDDSSSFEAYGKFFHRDDNEWIGDYNKLSKALDYLEDYRQEIFRISDNNTKACYDFQISAKNYIDNIPVLLSSFALDLSNKLGEDRWNSDLYKFVDYQIKAYYDLLEKPDGNPTDLNEINNLYLKPLIENILYNYVDQPFAKDIMDMCRSARGKLKEMENAMLGTIGEFEKFAESGKKEEETILSNIEKINEVISDNKN